MKLTKVSIEKISNRQATLKLALELGFSELWVNKLIQANKENGPLTTAKALRVIKEETGLDYSEILEEDNEVVSDSKDSNNF